MPWSGRARRAPARGNAVKCAVLPGLARRLLLLSSMGASACILPPPLDVESDDIGISSPPVVVEIAPQEFKSPGLPIQVEQADERNMILTVSDNDPEDLIFVRFFVDYARPDQTSFKADCSAPASGTERRQVTCSMATICNGISPDVAHFLEAVIADRPFLDTSDPRAVGQLPFRALPPLAGSTITAWTLECVEHEGG